MSRRLADLVNKAIEAAETSAAEDAARPPESTVRPGQRAGFIENRLSGFEEAARMVKRPIMRLRAADCAVWSGNARDYDNLTENRLRSLIDSIIVEGGNRVPVVVRRTPKGPLPFELVAGTRRHWAVAWLNRNNYPTIELLAIVEDLDDEAAFRLADLENRERADISDLERARNYRAAIAAYYGGVQKRMAERLKISETRLSRLLQLADLPADVIAAFASASDVNVKHGEQLMPALADPARRTKLLAEAEELATEQSFRRAEGQVPIEAPRVVQRLLRAAAPVRGRPERPPLMSHRGTPVGRVVKDTRRDGLTLVIDAKRDVATDDILEALRPVIEAARIRQAD